MPVTKSGVEIYEVQDALDILFDMYMYCIDAHWEHELIGDDH